MKSIELTEEHKSKLLEMCKILFPEYKYLIFGSSKGQMLFTKTKPFNQCGEDNGELDRECIQIHWFELCMTHLCNKIFYSDNQGKRNTRSKIEYFFFQSFIDSVEGSTFGYKHPIDYLYKEFKH